MLHRLTRTRTSRMRNRNRMVRTTIVLFLATSMYSTMMRRTMMLSQSHLMRLMSLSTVLIRFPNLPLGSQRTTGSMLRRQHRCANRLYRGFQLTFAPRCGSLVRGRNGVRLRHRSIGIREGKGIAGIRMGVELVKRMA